MRLPKMNWTFFIAGFCMVTGVLLPIGIAILVFWFYRDVKKFIKPEWSYTKDMFSSETKEELK